LAESLFTELKRRNVFRVGAAYLVLAWVIIQVTDTAVPALHLPEWVNSLVFFLGAIGFPFALFFAWAFEITPDGVKKESEVDREQSQTQTTGRKLDFVIISLLVVALGYFVWESRFDSERQTDQIEPAETTTNKATSANIEASASTTDQKVEGSSIAVLPFVNMSSDQEQEYFTDGISEEILNVLAKIPNLHVTSRSSAFSFKGKEIIISEVAKKLGVKNILEGSVRKSGSKIRITAQLIEAGTDKHLWSETYDRELVDVFIIQDEISAAIVAALKKELGLNAKVVQRDMSKVNLEAHNAYLKGRYFVERRTKPDLEIALMHFQRSVEIDPNYAPGWMGVAWATLFLSEDRYGDVLEELSVSIALPAAEKALILDPNLPEAHAIMAMIQSVRGNFDSVTSYLERALELNPNYADAYSWLADQVNWYPGWLDSHDPKEGLDLAAKAVSINPLSGLAIGNYGENLIALGRLDEAEAVVNQMIDLNPTSFGYFLFSEINEVKRKMGEAAYYSNLGVKNNPDAVGYKIYNASLLEKIQLGELAISGLGDSEKEKFFVLFIKKDTSELIKYIRANFPSHENDLYGYYTRAFAESYSENYQESIDYYLKSKICTLCDGLIYSYLKIGDKQSANKILIERRRLFNKAKNAGVKWWVYNPANFSGKAIMDIVEMNIEYLSGYETGDIEAAIELLSKSIQAGYILEPKYKIDPMYDKLRAHPKWKAILTESDAHAASERQIYLKLIETSDK
jgi:TolB-like protein